MRELGNDHGIGVWILTSVRQIREGPRSGGAIQEPLSRLGELVLNVLHQITVAGDETERRVKVSEIAVGPVK